MVNVALAVMEKFAEILREEYKALRFPIFPIENVDQFPDLTDEGTHFLGRIGKALLYRLKREEPKTNGAIKNILTIEARLYDLSAQEKQFKITELVAALKSALIYGGGYVPEYWPNLEIVRVDYEETVFLADRRENLRTALAEIKIYYSGC